MKILLFAVFMVVATQAKEFPRFDAQESTAFNYHSRFGIPLAEEIRNEEEKIFKNTRIIGGEQVSLRQVPYQAGLLINLEGMNGQSICGASLVTKNRLVTAAHCWYDGVNQAWRFTVILGSLYLYHGGSRIHTTHVVVMPDWTPQLIRNDGAVIYLPQDVVFSASIQPIPLATGDDLFVEQIGVASGFGLTLNDGSIGYHHYLSYVELPIISNEACNISFFGYIQPNMICISGANGRSTCRGDSGGPLVVEQNGEKVLAGITSFGSILGCDVGYPAVFVRVNAIRQFLDEHIPSS